MGINIGPSLKQVETFKYLGSMISENGGCEEEVRYLVGAR